jgi:hypothetical protein
MAKHTITLSNKAEAYLVELLYSLTGKDDKPATMSQCISESLENLSDFEKCTDDQLLSWLDTNFPYRQTSKKGTWHEKF